jgi:hypothetical protein
MTITLTYPALKVFDDLSSKVLAKNKDVNTDLDYAQICQTAGDRIIDKTGRLYRAGSIA